MESLTSAQDEAEFQGQSNADYLVFLATKRTVVGNSGIEVDTWDVNSSLFPFQNALTRWGLRKGKAALFATTGAGKTRMQVEWARLLKVPTLIVAPLAVAQQTIREAELLGVTVQYVRHQRDVTERIVITNYEMLDEIDPAQFQAVVLDESSILKGLTSKTRVKLIAMFKDTPYRLCCTATPAPNDIAEIANHAEFLGVMTRAEMLAKFFVHDSDTGWRLKGHAKNLFWQWLSGWGMFVRRPSDIAYSDEGFNLPPLHVEPTYVESGYVPDGQLFFTGLAGITDRTKVRKATVEIKLERVIDIIRAHPDEKLLVWCGLNAEQDLLAKALGSECVSVYGSLSIDEKIQREQEWRLGSTRIMLAKTEIFGFGLNFQHCHRMIFFGMNDSWESYFQAVRRCWRFKQEYPVTVHVVLADAEEEIWQNIQRKEKEAEVMAEELVKHVAEFERAELGVGARKDTFEYKESDAAGDNWRMMLGDSAERIREVPGESIALSVFSPPFESLFVYSPTERDLGNSANSEEFWTHFRFIIRELLRITMPGRNICVHCSDIPALLVKDGYIGLKDFPGDVIRNFVAEGFIYHGRVSIFKNPQQQAIRTHSKSLLFAQLRKDSSWSRPALADTIIILRKPGENAIPIRPQLTNDEWIEWASPLWTGIHESDTLNYAEARENDDERHIAPLQLGTIERCIRLWSNEGEMIFSPFAGIASEGYVALKQKRRFTGIELKPGYWKCGVRNLRRAEVEAVTPDLFTLSGISAGNEATHERELEKVE